MKWTNVRLILIREMRDQLRDRRTMFTIAVLPLLLYPLLGTLFLQIAQFTREHRTNVLVLNTRALPAEPALLDDDRFASDFASPQEAERLKLELRPSLPTGVPPDDVRSLAEGLIQSGDYDAIVYFPDDFGSKLQAYRDLSTDEDSDDRSKRSAPEPEIFVNTASDKSRIACDRVERVLSKWRQAIVQANLLEHHLPASATRPFDVVNRDVSRDRSRRAAVWSKILPFVVLVWALTGAFYPAIDLCAGEKERGTLETLLCSPAQRGEIVWGKLLTIMMFSVGTSLLNLASMGMTGAFVISRMAVQGSALARAGIGSPPLAALGWLLLAIVPIAALFSALALAVAAFARSSREGQYYLMPLLLITLPLMMLPLLPTAQLDLGTSLVPVTGIMLLLRSLIEGQYIEALRYAGPVLGITAICCLLAIRWAVDQFNNENVLFRESERWELGLWLRHLVRDRGDVPSLGEALLCGVLLLVIRFFAAFVFGTPDTWPRFATLTVVSLLAFVAAPALLMAVVLTRRPRKTLLLVMPRPASLAMAVLLALAIHPAGLAFAEGVKTLYPLSSEVAAQVRSIGRIIEQAPSLWGILLVLAIVPAVCEELAFRGFMLSGLRHMGHKWAAILACSVFFGATHGILQQSLNACALGIVLGYLAVQSGSILPPLLFHTTYNALTLALAWSVGPSGSAGPAWNWCFSVSESGASYRWPVIAASVLASACLLSWFRGLPWEASAEESLQQARSRGGGESGGQSQALKLPDTA